MSFDICDDIAQYLEAQGIGAVGVDIWTTVKYSQTGELRGILLEAPNPGDVPDVLIQTETVPLDVTICKGEGDQGREDTGNLAFRVFMALNLITDEVINGTTYLCVKSQTTPYEVKRDDRYYRVIRFDITRYYGDISATEA